VGGRAASFRAPGADAGPLAELRPPQLPPLGRKNTRNAITPANAVLNYLYGVLASELTIALTGVGLDPGLGIFHTDAARRASLAYDAMEAVRPAADGWLAAWLADASFSKCDFYEESDGTIRITRPLTCHLAMTAPIWPPAAQAVAGWLARAITEGPPEKRQPHHTPLAGAARPQASMARHATAHTEDLHRVRNSAEPEATQVLF
jgi:hypothetical protein